MKLSTNELLLALRAPNSGWLAALVCALEEALLDPDFGESQRRLVHQLLDHGAVPAAAASAANERLSKFEQSLEVPPALLPDLDDVPAPRPKLTLCGNAA
ncbi:MAG TPA: hypothetical protein VGC30_06255 [Dokdonella sp.]